MLRSLWTAATGMAAQQTNMDVISHNLANASTTGYKRSRANFEDLMYQNVAVPGVETSNNTQVLSGVQLGMGAKATSVDKIFNQGNVTETGNPYDLALEGRGFFKVLRGTEEVYTRAGAFRVDQEGFLCDAEGNRMQPEISIPRGAASVNIDPGGTVSAVDQNGKSVSTQTMTIYDFANPNGLMSLGRNYAVPTEASGEAESGQPGSDRFGTVLQGYLESSNINVVEEMVNMIVGQRAYEANSKVIKASDEMLQIANNVVKV
ncbi:MAG: flagellar basal-body rod protein FlgG [Syntrophobacteraceae bacterium]